MDDDLGVGIVGTGTMARAHAAVLADYHRAHVAAWCTRRPDQTAELDEYGPATVYGNLDDFLADDSVRAVLVATPDHLHAQAALAAIEAGRHVLVEKPLATTAGDARAIRDAARRAGVVVMTLYNHRFVPAYWQAKEQTSDRRLGTPVLAYARKNDTIHVPTQLIRWAGHTTPSFFLSSHDLDLLLWYFESEVIEVYATAAHGVLESRGVPTPDAVQAQLRLACGAVATLEACWIYPDTFPTMTDSFMELVFTEGVLHMDRKQEQLEVASTKGHFYPRNLLLNRIGGKPAGAVALAVRHFVDVVVDGLEPLIDLDSSVHVTEVLAAIDESWRQARPVTLQEAHS